MINRSSVYAWILLIFISYCESDPCVDDINTCDLRAICTPTSASSYTCQCKSGYKGNGTYCYADVVKLHPGNCKSHQFQCFDGECISISQVRNGDKDCSQEEDEECDADQQRYIKCDFLCVDPEKVTTQCPNGKHKLYCTHFGMTPYFMCTDQNMCIPAEWVSDGRCNCGDCSDERTTTTSSTSTTTPTTTTSKSTPTTTSTNSSTSSSTTKPTTTTTPTSTSTTTQPPPTTTSSTSTSTNTKPTTTSTRTSTSTSTSSSTPTTTTKTTPTTTSIPPATTQSTSSVSSPTKQSPPVDSGDGLIKITPSRKTTTTTQSTSSTAKPTPDPQPTQQPVPSPNPGPDSQPNPISTANPNPTANPNAGPTAVSSAGPNQQPTPTPNPNTGPNPNAQPTTAIQPMITSSMISPTTILSADEEAFLECWNKWARNANTKMKDKGDAICVCAGLEMKEGSDQCSYNVTALQLSITDICNSKLNFSKYNSSLTDVHSDRFKELATMIYTGLDEMIKNNETLKNSISKMCVAQVPMRAGSVVGTVLFQLNSTTPNDAATAINGALRNSAGALGNSGLKAATDVAANDVDECSARINECDAHATCKNTFGGYTCTCDSGYKDVTKSGDRVGSVCTESTDECASNLFIGTDCVAIAWIVVLGLLCALLLFLFILLLCCICCSCCPYYRGNRSHARHGSRMRPHGDRQTQTENDLGNDIYDHRNVKFRDQVISLSPDHAGSAWDSHAWPDQRPGTTGTHMTPTDIHVTDGAAHNEDLNHGYVHESHPPSDLPLDAERRRKTKKKKRASSAIAPIDTDGHIDPSRQSAHRERSMTDGGFGGRRNSVNDAMNLDASEAGRSVPSSPIFTGYNPGKPGKAPPHWKLWTTRPGYFGREHKIYDD